MAGRIPDMKPPSGVKDKKVQLVVRMMGGASKGEDELVVDTKAGSLQQMGSGAVVRFGGQPGVSFLSDAASQGEVYRACGCRELVEELSTASSDNFKNCIIVMGPRGGGKTHTVIGGSGDIGLVPRLASDLLSNKEAAAAGVTVSCFQVPTSGGESVRDVLAPQASRRTVAQLPHGQGAVVENLTTSLLTRQADIFSVVDKAVKASRSSAGHTVFLLSCKGRGSIAVLDASSECKLSSRAPIGGGALAGLLPVLAGGSAREGLVQLLKPYCGRACVVCVLTPDTGSYAWASEAHRHMVGARGRTSGRAGRGVSSRSTSASGRSRAGSDVGGSDGAGSDTKTAWTDEYRTATSGGYKSDSMDSQDRELRPRAESAGSENKFDNSKAQGHDRKDGRRGGKKERGGIDDDGKGQEVIWQGAEREVVKQTSEMWSVVSCATTCGSAAPSCPDSAAWEAEKEVLESEKESLQSEVCALVGLLKDMQDSGAEEGALKERCRELEMEVQRLQPLERALQEQAATLSQVLAELQQERHRQRREDGGGGEASGQSEQYSRQLEEMVRQLEDKCKVLEKQCAEAQIVRGKDGEVVESGEEEALEQAYDDIRRLLRENEALRGNAKKGREDAAAEGWRERLGSMEKELAEARRALEEERRMRREGEEREQALRIDVRELEEDRDREKKKEALLLLSPSASRKLSGKDTLQQPGSVERKSFLQLQLEEERGRRKEGEGREQALREELASKDSELWEAQEKVKMLGREKEMLEGRERALCEANAGLEREVAAMEREREVLEHKRRSLLNGQESLRAEVEALQDEIARLERRAAAADALEKDVELCKRHAERAEGLDKEVARLEELRQALESDLEAHQVRVDRMDKEREQLQERLGKVEGELEAAIVQVGRLEEEGKSARREADDRGQALMETQDELGEAHEAVLKMMRRVGLEEEEEDEESCNAHTHAHKLGVLCRRLFDAVASRCARGEASAAALEVATLRIRDMEQERDQEDGEVEREMWQRIQESQIRADALQLEYDESVRARLELLSHVGEARRAFSVAQAECRRLEQERDGALLKGHTCSTSLAASREDLHRLAAEVQQAGEQLHRAQEDVEGLQDALQNARLDAAAAQVKVRSLERANHEAEQDALQSRQEAASLRNEVALHKQKIEVLDKEMEVLGLALEKAQEGLQEAEERANGEIDALRRRLANAEEQLQGEQERSMSELQSLQDKYQQTTSQLVSLRRTLEEACTDGIRREEERWRLVHEVAELERDMGTKVLEARRREEELLLLQEKLAEGGVQAGAAEAECEELRRKVEGLKGKVAEQEEYLAGEQAEWSVLERALDKEGERLKGALRRCEEDLAMSNKTLQEVREACERCTEEAERMRGERGALAEQNEALVRETERLEGEAEERHAQVRRLQQEFELAESANEGLARDKAMLAEELQGLHAHVSDLEATKEELACELAAARASVNALESSLTGLQADVGELKASEESLLHDNARLIAELKGLYSKVTVLEAEVAELESNKASLFKDNENFARELTGVYADVEALELDKGRLRQENERLLCGVRALEKEKQALEKENETLGNEKEALEKEIGALEESAAALAREDRHRERAIEGLQAELAQGVRMWEEAKENVRRKEGDIRLLRSETSAMMRGREVELQGLKRVVHCFEHDMKNLQKDVLERSQLVESLRDEIKNKEANINKLRQNVKQREEEEQRLRNTLTCMEGDMHLLQREMKEVEQVMQGEIDVRDAKITSLEREASALRRSTAQLNEHLDSLALARLSAKRQGAATGDSKAGSGGAAHRARGHPETNGLARTSGNISSTHVAANEVMPDRLGGRIALHVDDLV